MDLIEIEKYIKRLHDDEENFKHQSLKSDFKALRKKEDEPMSLFLSAIFIIQSIFDYILLVYALRFKKDFLKNKRIVFTTMNFCIEKNGSFEDRIVRPLFKDHILFINHSKEIRINRINNQRVFNLGGVVKLRSHLFYCNQSKLMRIFNAYRSVNDSILKRLRRVEVYTLCYYDFNGLSLVFSKYRQKFILIEIQHGSIINYPPYVEPAPIKIADIFYVKNQHTIDYLKTHLCSIHPSEYRLIPYQKGDIKNVPGLHLLYASTLEFNGLHPVFKDFLRRNTNKELHVIIRLHPREMDKKDLFSQELSEYRIKYEFDNSKNWLEGNNIKNLIVISPWSSIIEEAVDNEFTSIIIDKVGKHRYGSLIDNKNCFYSEDLALIINNITVNCFEKG